ncbi:MAG: flagellar protein FlaR [Gemmatimonadaceae bacterium]
MQRVAIIGNAGGGKSVLARELGRARGLPVHAIDDVQWRPGWTRTPVELVAAAHASWLEESAWVIDGWGDWTLIAQRFEAADTIVFVDFPLWRHRWWAMKRQAECMLGLRKDWPPPGCRALPVTRRLWSVMTYVHRELRPRLLALAAAPRFAAKVVRIRSPRELAAFRRRAHPGE